MRLNSVLNQTCYKTYPCENVVYCHSPRMAGRSLYIRDPEESGRLEFDFRIVSGVISSALCLLTIVFILWRRKYLKNDFEALSLALFSATLVDSVSWIITLDPSTAEYKEDDYNSKVIKMSLGATFLQRCSSFVSSSVTCYMSFSLFYTIWRGKKVPRKWFWPFLILSVSIGLFYSIYELLQRQILYKTYADEDPTAYFNARDSRKRLFISWSFFRALFTLADCVFLAGAYFLFRRLVRQDGLGATFQQHPLHELFRRMFLYPCVQIVTKFAVTWYALRGGSWTTTGGSQDDDYDRPYYKTIDILHYCITPLTGAGYALIYIRFTPGIRHILLCKGKEQRSRLQLGLKSQTTATTTTIEDSIKVKSTRAPMLRRSMKKLSRMEEYELYSCLERSVVPVKKLPSTAAAAAAATIDESEGNGNGGGKSNQSSVDITTLVRDPAERRGSLTALRRTIINITQSFDITYELANFEEGDEEEGEEGEEGQVEEEEGQVERGQGDEGLGEGGSTILLNNSHSS